MRILLILLFVFFSSIVLGGETYIYNSTPYRKDLQEYKLSQCIDCDVYMYYKFEIKEFKPNNPHLVRVPHTEESVKWMAGSRPFEKKPMTYPYMFSVYFAEALENNSSSETYITEPFHAFSLLFDDKNNLTIIRSPNIKGYELSSYLYLNYFEYRLRNGFDRYNGIMLNMNHNLKIDKDLDKEYMVDAIVRYITKAFMSYDIIIVYGPVTVEEADTVLSHTKNAIIYDRDEIDKKYREIKAERALQSEQESTEEQKNTP